MKLLDKIDEALSLNEVVGASVWTNPKIESELSKVGFDIPKYPKTGVVKLNGDIVGRMDNFNGLSIYYKYALDLIKKTVPRVAIWNPKLAD
jgi:hypothetical protein